MAGVARPVRERVHRRRLRLSPGSEDKELYAGAVFPKAPCLTRIAYDLHVRVDVSSESA